MLDTDGPEWMEVFSQLPGWALIALTAFLIVMVTAGVGLLSERLDFDLFKDLRNRSLSDKVIAAITVVIAALLFALLRNVVVHL